MPAYIARRVLQVIPVLLGATLILFALQYVVPSDPVQLMVGERAVTPELRAAIESHHDLDEPPMKRYLIYVQDLLKGDLGISYQQGRPVADILKETFPYSIALAFAAILIEVVIGLAAGIISAVKRYSFWDVLTTLSTSILVAIPVFWLGYMLQSIVGLRLGWLPISWEPGGGPEQLVLPAITLAAVSTAYVARLTRSQLVDAMQQDYARTAAAKGLSEGGVVRRHALRNALLPVITFIGLDLGVLMGGAVLTEAVFNWPGVGYEIYQAIGARDQPVIFGAVLVLVVIFVFVNLAVDVSYAFIDPRIRLGKEAAE